MSLMTASSMESRWRGYEFYRNRNVSTPEALGNGRFQAVVSVSENEAYRVTIDLEHLHRSSCTCSRAASGRAVCKHMVAVFFAAFPEEAERYYAEDGKLEGEWRGFQGELTGKLVRYVRGLERQEAQELLLQLLETGPEWQRDGFIREHIGPTDFHSADLKASGSGK